MTRKRKIVIGICFTIYLGLLLYLTIFSRIDTLHFIWEDGRFQHYIKNNFNIFPFQSILYIWNHLSIKQVFLNIIGNILAFIPFGLFLPYLKKNIKFISFFGLMILMSFTIELSQLITVSGSFDVDDIILNVLGASISYFMLHHLDTKPIVSSTFPRKTNIQKLFDTLFICIILFGSITCFLIYFKKEIYLPNKLYFINRSKNCKQEEELFYENDYFEYYLPCPNEYYISLNHNEYRIKEALNKKIIGIEQLETFYFPYTKKSKYQSIDMKTAKRELLLKELDNAEMLEIKEISEYQSDKILYHLYIKPLLVGKTTLHLKIVNSNTGEVKKEMKYEIVVSDDLNTIIQLIPK